MSRLITEYRDTYLKISTDMGKPTKNSCVRCTHIKRDSKQKIDAPANHCKREKRRCLRFCARHATRSVADFKYLTERQACYEKALPEVWSSVCACDTEGAQKCQCSQSEEAAMSFVQNALIRMPQLVSPLAYQTSGQEAETEPKYTSNMFKKDLKSLNEKDGGKMELFEYI